MSCSNGRWLAFAAGIACLAAGCTEPIAGALVPNLRPSVEFTHAPISVNPDSPEHYAYRVFWAGDDLDGRGQDPGGQIHDRPVSYRHRLLSMDDPKNRIFLTDPDSLRRRDAPGFADWDSTGPDTTFAFVLQDLSGSNREPVDRGMTERPGAGMAMRPATLRTTAPVRAPALRVTRVPQRR